MRALLPDLIFAACVFALLGTFSEPGLDFLDGLSEAGRHEVRLFFEDHPQAREHFRADAAEQFGQMSVAAGWLELPGLRLADRHGPDDLFAGLARELHKPLSWGTRTRT